MDMLRSWFRAGFLSFGLPSGSFCTFIIIEDLEWHLVYHTYWYLPFKKLKPRNSFKVINSFEIVIYPFCVNVSSIFYESHCLPEQKVNEKSGILHFFQISFMF